MSLHSLETWLFEMPARPIACTSPSTRRVETPPIHASWITVTSAFSAVLRGSRNGGKVRSLAQLGDAQLQRAEARVQTTLAISVAVIEPVSAALVTAGADQAFDIGLHQNLQHRLGHGSQKIAITALLQQVNQRHSVVGHRILGGSRVKRCNSTLAALPGDHLSLTRAPGSKFSRVLPDARPLPNFDHDRGR